MRDHAVQASDSEEMSEFNDADVGMQDVTAPDACKVATYKESSKGVNIRSWLYQMENYMELNGIPRGFWVKTCMANFHTQHFDQVGANRHMHYREFKKKVIEIFRKPDMTQYRIKELCTIRQDKDEAPDAFMTRIRTIAREAFRNLPDGEQQMLAVNAFCGGLKECGVAALVAT